MTHDSAVPTYSAKTGRLPNSERMQTRMRLTYDTTVVPAPKKTEVTVSQRAALFAISHSGPFHADGRTFYPSVLFGLVTNSVMQSACNIPGLLPPAQPSAAPTTACRKGLFYQGTPMWVVIQHGFCTAPTGGGAVPLGATTTTAAPHHDDDHQPGPLRSLHVRQRENRKGFVRRELTGAGVSTQAIVTSKNRARSGYPRKPKTELDHRFSRPSKPFRQGLRGTSRTFLPSGLR